MRVISIALVLDQGPSLAQRAVSAYTTPNSTHYSYCMQRQHTIDCHRGGIVLRTYLTANLIRPWLVVRLGGSSPEMELSEYRKMNSVLLS